MVTLLLIAGVTLGGIRYFAQRPAQPQVDPEPSPAVPLVAPLDDETVKVVEKAGFWVKHRGSAEKGTFPSFTDIAVNKGEMARHSLPSRLAALPQIAVPFELEFDERCSPSDEGLKQLAKQSNLRALRVAQGESITAAGLSHLTGIPALEELSLGVSVTDDGLVQLSKLPRLKSLNLGVGMVTEDGFKHLAAFPALQSLSLNLGVTKVSDAGLKHLAEMSNLKSLSLTVWTDAQLQQLVGVGNITALRLAYSDVTDEGMKHLAGHSRLQSITCSSPRVTGTAASLKHLTGLTNLQTLRFAHISEDGLQVLADAGLLHCLTRAYVTEQNSKVVDLNLYQMPVTDAMLRSIEGKTNFNRLNLHSTKVTDEGLKHLAGLTHLESLDLSDSCFGLIRGGDLIE